MSKTRAQGVAIVIVLLVLSILTVVAAAVVMLGTGNLALAGRQVFNERAYYAAEAGVTITLVRLKANPAYAGAAGTVTGTNDTYATQVFQAPAVAPNGVPLPSADYRYILSTGTASNGTRRQVGMLVRLSSGLYDYAIFARETINIENSSTITWYSSATGMLEPAGGRGNIGTNLDTKGAIIVESLSNVKGGAFFGPGAAKSALQVKAGAVVEDGQKTMLSDRELAPVVLPPPRGPAAPPPDAVVMPADPDLGADLNLSPGFDLGLGLNVLPPGNYRNVVLNGGVEVTFVNGGAGYYNFKSLSLVDGSIQVLDPVTDPILGVSNPVPVYIETAFNMGNGATINYTGQPPMFDISVMTGPVNLKTAKKADGTTSGYFTLYAPDADVKLEGKFNAAKGITEPSEVWGSIIGKNITIKNASKVVYDLELNSNTTGASNIEVLSHQRL